MPSPQQKALLRRVPRGEQHRDLMTEREQYLHLDAALEYALLSNLPLYAYPADHERPPLLLRLNGVSADHFCAHLAPLTRDLAATHPPPMALEAFQHKDLLIRMGYKNSTIAFPARLVGTENTDTPEISQGERQYFFSRPTTALLTNSRTHDRIALAPLKSHDIKATFKIATHDGERFFQTSHVMDLSRSAIGLFLNRSDGLLLPDDTVTDFRLFYQGRPVIETRGQVIRVDTARTIDDTPGTYLAVIRWADTPREETAQEGPKCDRRVERTRMTDGEAGYIEVRHPLLANCLIKGRVLDFSTSGVSFVTKPTSSPLSGDSAPVFPGMIFTGFDIRFPHQPAVTAMFKVIYCHELIDNPTYSLRIGGMFISPARELLRAVRQTAQTGAAVGVVDATDQDLHPLLHFFTGTGFLDPRRSHDIGQAAINFSTALSRLLRPECLIARNILLKHHDAIKGHLGAIQFFDRAWLFQHLHVDAMADLSAEKDLLLSLAASFSDPAANRSLKAQFLMAYLPTTSSYASFLFRHVKKALHNAHLCNSADFDCCVPDDRSIIEENPAAVLCREATPEDACELENLLLRQGQQSRLRLEGLDMDHICRLRIAQDYEALGLYRRRRVFVARTSENDAAAFAVCNYASPGLNISELTNSFCIYHSSPTSALNPLLSAGLCRMVVASYHETGVPKPVLIAEKNQDVPPPFFRTMACTLWYVHTDCMKAFTQAAEAAFADFAETRRPKAATPPAAEKPDAANAEPPQAVSDNEDPLGAALALSDRDTLKRINSRYRLIRKLGEGGMGRVYLAADEAEGERPVAIKILKNKDHRRSLKRFVTSEFDFLRSLAHEHIARVFDFGLIEDTPIRFFTSEYIEGQDAYLFTKNCESADLIDITVQICRALHYIHLNGIIHSDIKPSNVLICSENGKPRAKLLDFGVSSHTRMSLRRRIAGTPGYMAPELLFKEDYDHRIDLYSLGMTLYAFVYRRLPFDDRDSKDDPTRRYAEPISFDIPKRHPSALIDIIKRLVERYPWNRYQSANEVIRDINERLGTSYSLEPHDKLKQYPSPTRLLEREDVMKYFGGIIQNICNAKLEQSHNVLIRGAKGTGKSRLLAELKSQAQMQGALVILFDAAEDRSNPLLPTGDFALPKRIQVLLGGTENAMTAPGAESPVPDITQTSDHEAFTTEFHIRKFGFFKTLSESLFRSALRKPILMLVDNVHLLDPLSLDFCSYLTADLKALFGKLNPQFSLIATTLDDGAPQPTPPLSHTAIFDNTLVLANFKKEETLSEYVRLSLDIRRPPQRLISQLYAMTQGNPLLTAEFLAQLSATGLAYVGDACEIPDAIDLSTFKTPSLEAIQLHQIQRLSQSERILLAWLSCFTGGCPMDILFDLAKENVTVTTYHDLVRKRLIRDTGPERTISFADLGLKAVIYQQIDAGERLNHHQTILSMLEELQPSDCQAYFAGKITTECAHHAAQGGHPPKAVYYNRLAAEAASRAGRLHESIRHWEICLSYRDHLPTDFASEILFTLIHLHSLVGDYTTALECCDRIRTEAPKESALYREATLQLVSIHKDLGHYALCLEILEALEASRAGALEITSDLERARLCNLRAACFLATSQFDAAIACSKQSLSFISQSTHDSRLVPEKIRAISNLAQANSFLGKVPEAIALLTEALPLADKSTHPMERCQLLTRLGYACGLANRMMEGLDYYLRAHKLVTSIHWLRGQSIVATNLGNTYFKLGDIGKSLEHFEEANRTALKLNSLTEQAFSLTSLGNIYRILGLAKRSEDALVRAYQLASQLGLAHLQNVLCQYLISLFLGTKDFQNAHHWYDTLKEIAAGNPTGSSHVSPLELDLILMEILVREENLEAADTLSKTRHTEMVGALEIPSLDTYYLLRGQILLGHHKNPKTAQKALEKAIAAYTASKQDSSDIDHLDLLLEISCCYARCLADQKRLEEAERHYGNCLTLISKMLLQIPEPYHKSFMAHANRLAIQRETQNSGAEKMIVR